MKKLVYLVILPFVFSCAGDHSARSLWKEDQYAEYLLRLAPYVNKKQDNVAFKDRFNTDQQPYYREMVKAQKAEIPYAMQTGTGIFFLYVNKDLTSLFEHYRAFGGYFKEDGRGNITFLRILFYTPRLTSEEMAQRGKELFESMAKTGDINSFLSNPQYVDLPNSDFYYNVTENRWDYTDSSSWDFLKDVKTGSDDAK